jgi:hypothetical protein
MKTLHQLLSIPALAALLVAAPPARAAQTGIPGPTGSGTFGKTVTYLPNGNFVVTDPTYSLTTPTAVASVGAVYLYNGSTLALISTLTGSTAGNEVGVGGVTVLSNGNFVVRSSKWDNGAAADAGAVTWGSATAGVSGTVSATNSLVGSTASDGVGSQGVTVLTNGNYVVNSNLWDSGAVVNAGASTWGSGTTGISGTISTANSLVGSNANDKVGVDGNLELTNGNYVVPAPTWNGSRGAVTWCNGVSGSSGVVSASNSLVGSTAADQVGRWVSALKNGNYATASSTWDNGAVVDAGAVTWGNGTTGTKGAVSATNSLVGSTLNDQVGTQIDSRNGILVLDNGNFVVASSEWNNGAVVDAGAVTWCNGTGGTVGTISAANSLVGSTTNDRVSTRTSNNALYALSNGNYIVISVSWDNGAVVDAGAVTWGNGTTGTKGAVSATNSLVGSKTLDFTKARPLILSNGNYVVGNGAWDNGAVVDAGALTWCNGTVGTVGTISAANSLVGSTASDSVGSATFAGSSNNINATALTNGNYVAYTPAWDNGAVVNAGAVTWCNGTGGTVGTISAANSLVGSTESDQVGSSRAIALSNGNYVVGSSNWNNGAVGSAGAATWGNGTGGTVGPVSAANSLVSSASDGVGTNMHALANGNYVVRSIAWDNGAVLNAGAVTWGSGTTGISGTISAANSLVGSSASDAVGFLFVELSNSNFVVGSPSWDNGAVLNAGAVTWGSGTTGTTGAVSAANSLVGSTLNDGLGNSAAVALSNGNYLVTSSNWDNGALTQAGAITLGNGSGGTAGAVSAVNSVLGTVAGGSSGLVYSYNATADKLLVGQPSAKQVTQIDKIPVVLAAPSDATVASGASVSFTATASGDPAPTLQWQVSTNGGVNWTDVSGATASPYTFTASAADTGKKYRVVFTNASGSTTSTAATLTVTVNTAHQATAQAVTTAEDTAVAITLTGTNPSGTPLTYAVASGPANGSLSGTPPDLTYTPAANYSGSDSFTFTASDGTADSAPATVSLSVTPVNDAPLATDQSRTTAEDTAVAITLVGTDPDGDPLTYAVVTGPTNGSLSGSAPNLTYTPALNYSGSDSFTFKVNDGTVDSATATVSLTVTPVNDTPLATAKSVTTVEDTPVAITLAGTDAEVSPLTYAVVAPPANGSLSGSAPNLTYTPAANYNGSDSFTFKVNDGTVDSATATVSLTVTSVNDAPLATAKSVTTAEDIAVAITLAATDAEGSPLTYAVVTAPANGTLSGTAPNLTYTPAANYNGSDSFTFKVNDGTVDSATATVSLTVTPVNDAALVIAQQAYLKPSSISADDFFGYSVAVSGETVVVGAISEDSSTTGVNTTPNESASAAGAVYVFVRSGGAWTQQAYLKASQVSASDEFGYAVAISGDTVVVGARDEDSSTTGVNSTANESALDSGAAYVFVRSGTTWTQQAYLKASQVSASDHFGTEVAVSGDTLVVGAPDEDSSTTGVNSTANESAVGSGAAYVFVRGGTTWTQQAYLKASNTGAGDNLGTSVAVAGNTVVVGASKEDSSTTGVNSTSNESATAAGAAYVFVRSGTTWTQQAYLKASQVTLGDYFGYSVAISGDTVVVSAIGENSSTTGVNSTANESASDSGAVYVFVRSGTTWTQQAYLKASQVSGSDYFGISVAVSGDTVVVGANQEDSSTTGVNSIPNESASQAGAAYVFVRMGTTWTQQGYLKASNTGARDIFGQPVAISGNTVVVGAWNEDSSTTGVNTTANESAADAGAAYAFTVIENNAPVATAQSVTTAEDTAVAITLAGTDADDDPLTYSVTTSPAHGTLSGSAPNLTYTPAADYYGSDSFTFTVSDGTVDTSTARVSLTVTRVNTAPLATAQSVTTAEDSALAITLAGTDGEGNPLTYAVATGPANGSLSGTAPNLTYTPATNYHGSDSFTFKVNDGTVDSATATVSITVTEVKAIPVFSGYTASVKTGKTLAIAPAKILARASDPDGGAVTLTRVFGPSAQGGTVSLTGTVNYTPAASFTGTDSFDIELTGSQGGTLRATLVITVTGDAALGLNQTELNVHDGVVDLTFRGIPGRSYLIQRSTNLTTWTTLATVTAAADGKIRFTDTTPPQPSGYYRTQN